MSMVDHLIWSAAGGGELNPEGAIYKLFSAAQVQVGQ